MIFEPKCENGLHNHQKSIRFFTIKHMAVRHVAKPYKTNGLLMILGSPKPQKSPTGIPSRFFILHPSSFILHPSSFIRWRMKDEGGNSSFFIRWRIRQFGRGGSLAVPAGAAGIPTVKNGNLRWLQSSMVVRGGQLFWSFGNSAIQNRKQNKTG